MGQKFQIGLNSKGQLFLSFKFLISLCKELIHNHLRLDTLSPVSTIYAKGQVRCFITCRNFHRTNPPPQRNVVVVVVVILCSSLHTTLTASPTLLSTISRIRYTRRMPHVRTSTSLSAVSRGGRHYYCQPIAI